ISVPELAATVLTWQDELPRAGTYGYRVYATTPNGTYAGEVRLTFVPGSVSSSTEYVAPAGGGAIASVEGSAPVIATANNQPTFVNVQPAGPTQLAPTALDPGWGILIKGPVVPNAVGYRIQRRIAGSVVQGAPISGLYRGPRADREF